MGGGRGGGHLLEFTFKFTEIKGKCLGRHTAQIGELTVQLPIEYHEHDYCFDGGRISRSADRFISLTLYRIGAEAHAMKITYTCDMVYDLQLKKNLWSPSNRAWLEADPPNQGPFALSGPPLDMGGGGGGGGVFAWPFFLFHK